MRVYVVHSDVWQAIQIKKTVIAQGVLALSECVTGLSSNESNCGIFVYSI